MDREREIDMYIYIYIYKEFRLLFRLGHVINDEQPELSAAVGSLYIFTCLYIDR